jgi:hypothetical protein
MPEATGERELARAPAPRARDRAREKASGKKLAEPKPQTAKPRKARSGPGRSQ